MSQDFYFKLLQLLSFIGQAAVDQGRRIIAMLETPIKILTWTGPLWAVFLDGFVNIIIVWTIFKWANPLS